MATAPSFIQRDLQEIEQETKAWYEEVTGKPFQPAQPETLLVNGQVYREGIVRSQIQQAALQNLVRFSNGAILDYHAERVGVFRLPALPAQTTIRVLMGSELIPDNFLIPAGTRFSNGNGAVIFETVEDRLHNVENPIWTTDIVTGYRVTTFLCEAAEPGIAANGYDVGQINTCLDLGAFDDAAPFLLEVSNTTMTAGGADAETDASLIERVLLAPNRFSVAGPSGAYQFWARSVSADIVDVAVTTPVPGTVRLFPLYFPANASLPSSTPTELLDDVLAACSAEDRRPICDTVEVQAPGIQPHTVNVTLVRYINADQPTVVAAVQAALTALFKAKARKLGDSLPVSQIIGAIMRVDGVYSATTATTDLTAGPTQVLACTVGTVTVSGTYNPSA